MGMTLRPLFHSDQDCRDRLKPGKTMFFNVFVLPDPQTSGRYHKGRGTSQRNLADYSAFSHRYSDEIVYRIVVKAKPTPSPEENAA